MVTAAQNCLKRIVALFFEHFCSFQGLKVAKIALIEHFVAIIVDYGPVKEYRELSRL
jgi:hypothetical protein